MIEIHDCEQGTPEWRKVRAGVPTASEFSTVMASGRDGGDSKTRRTYMLKLAGEILTGEPAESFSNAHTDRGHEQEPGARDLYALLKDVEPIRVGFIRNGRKGCSPDSLIGEEGALEIKTKLPHLHIDALLKDKFLAEHVAQCQGVLWVSEREWIDLTVYCPKLPPLIKRAYRDEAYIAKLAASVDQFNEELDELVEKIRAYGVAA